MAEIKKSIYLVDNNSCAMDRGTLAKVNNSTTALAGSNPISIPGPILAGSTTLRLDGVSGSVGAIGYRFSANIFNLGYNYAVAISRCGNGDTFQIFAIPGRDTPNSLSGLLGMSFGVVYKGATDDYKFSDLRDAYSSEKSTITMEVPRDGGVLISKTHAFALILTSIQNMVGADELSKFIYHNPSGIQKMLVTLALQLESKGNIGAPLTDIGAASRDAIVETSSDWLEDMIGSYYPPFKLLMKYGKVTSILVAYSEAKNSAKGGDEINLSNLYIKSICRKNIIYGGGSSW